ncbi:MAG: DUF6074 family protein [Xanthobacteraceae bacterium]
MVATNNVFPFPIVKRADFIARQAAYAASLKRESGEAHIHRQIETQRAVMQRRGIAPGLIEREVRALENAIRAALWREVFAGGAA